MIRALLLLAGLTPLALESVPVKPKVWPYERQETPRAYFVLQATDMDSKPNWPEDYLKFSLVVANASISAAPGLVRANTQVPDCLLLAYRNFSDIEVADSRSGAFWDSLETAFDTTFCIRDLDDGGRCVRMQDGGDTIPAWIPFQQSIDAFMAHFDASVWIKDWDGIYLDEYTNPYPAWRFALLPANYDIDGDGVADDSTKLVEQREAGRAYIAQRIRASIGSDAVFIANTAGALAGGGCFNGITIEGIASTADSTAAIAEFAAQDSVSVEPKVHVVWVTAASQERRAVGVARAHPNVWLGTTIGVD